MANRKISKVENGNKTTIREKYGSSYKKQSIYKTEITQYLSIEDEGCKEEFIQMSKITHISLLEEIENNIKGWLDKNGLPTEDIDDPKQPKSLVQRLNDHFNGSDEKLTPKGLQQAISCLKSIFSIKVAIENEMYSNALFDSLQLASVYSRWQISIVEPLIAKGNYRDIQSQKTLSEEEENKCFEYFEKCLFSSTRSYTKKERWKKTAHFAKETFGKNISPDTLRKAYAKK
jgi:hypothetical protein